MRDLFNDSERQVFSNRTGRRVTEEYDYTSEDGALLYTTVRYEPKDFRQKRPDSNGGWVWSLNGTVRVPYHLAELRTELSAVQPSSSPKAHAMSSPPRVSVTLPQRMPVAQAGLGPQSSLNTSRARPPSPSLPMPTMPEGRLLANALRCWPRSVQTFGSWNSPPTWPKGYDLSDFVFVAEGGVLTAGRASVMGRGKPQRPKA